MDLSIAALSLTLENLAIADRHAPMQNLVTAGRIQGAVKARPLLSKKINIDLLEATDLRWGTARDKSGALPPGRLKTYDRRKAAADRPTSPIIQRLKQMTTDTIRQLPAWDQVRDMKQRLADLSLEGLVRPEELETVREARRLEQTYTDKAAAYDDKLKDLKIGERIDTLTPMLNDLRNTQIKSPRDILAAKEKIQVIQKQISCPLFHSIICQKP